MKIIKVKNQLEGAKVGLDILKSQIAAGAKTFGLATGSTPVEFYNQIINSDIDLFILADDPEAVRAKFTKIDLDRELRPVIVSPMEMALMETSDKVFLNEIRKGTVLWEATDEDR